MSGRVTKKTRAVIATVVVVLALALLAGRDGHLNPILVALAVGALIMAWSGDLNEEW